MYRSMYDLLNKSIDYRKEYEKLWYMLFNERYYLYNGVKYALVEIFSKFIVFWKYKGTKCNCSEVMEELELQKYPTTTAEESILKLSDFIINIHEFLVFEEKRLNKEANKAEYLNEYCVQNEIMKVTKRLYIDDKILVDLVKELLNSLNYEYIKKEDYQCFIIKKNIDAEETAKIIEDQNIVDKILQYNDYTIVNDINEKKAILKYLADYFEGIKPKIKQYNSSLEKNISFALNNFNIRHNNKTGKNANNFIKNISDIDLIKLYDELYFIMLIAFRLIELPTMQNNIEYIRKNNFEKLK